MADKDYISREAILKDYQTICNGVECVRCPIRDKGHCKFEAYIRSIPAADVRPVVTCERCVYHVDCGYHYCNKWCVNCPDDADFFCAYGEEES